MVNADQVFSSRFAVGTKERLPFFILQRPFKTVLVGSRRCDGADTFDFQFLPAGENLTVVFRLYRYFFETVNLCFSFRNNALCRASTDRRGLPRRSWIALPELSR